MAAGQDAGFTKRHPALRTSKGTIQLRPEDAAGIPDDEISGLVPLPSAPGSPAIPLDGPTETFS